LDIIHITELPIGVWSEKYITNITEKRADYIQDIRESCSPTDLDITIYLKEGAMQAIEKKFGREHLTAIEHCFNLSDSMQPFLNFTDQDGIVHTFKSYKDIMKTWYPIRKALYEVRLRRMHIMTKLRILYLENIIRFVENYKKMNLPYKPEDEVLEILTHEKYRKFVKSPIDDPGYVPIDKLKEAYLGGKADYDYLVRLGTKDMYTKAIEAHKKKLENYKATLADIEDTDGMWLGAKWWIKELEHLKKVITIGRETNWRFGNNEVIEDN
jgi:hypothetical protein